MPLQMTTEIRESLDPVWEEWVQIDDPASPPQPIETSAPFSMLYPDTFLTTALQNSEIPIVTISQFREEVLENENDFSLNAGHCGLLVLLGVAARWRRVQDNSGQLTLRAIVRAQELALYLADVYRWAHDQGNFWLTRKITNDTASSISGESHTYPTSLHANLQIANRYIGRARMPSDQLVSTIAGQAEDNAHAQQAIRSFLQIAQTAGLPLTRGSINMERINGIRANQSKANQYQDSVISLLESIQILQETVV